MGIHEQRTLEGLIDKIFDKALTDTHFSELYANMCKVGVCAHNFGDQLTVPRTVFACSAAAGAWVLHVLRML